MDFGLTAEQRLLQENLRRYLAESLPRGSVRALAASETAYDPASWKELAKLGITGILVAEEYGGSGLDLLDAALVAEILGERATPAPFLGTSVMASVCLASAGTPVQRREWLPRIASGATCFGVAVNELVAVREGAGVHLADGRLVGNSLFAIDSGAADAFLAAVGPGAVALVSRTTPGVAVRDLPTVDRTRRLGEICFDGALPEEWIGGPEGAEAALTRMLDAGRVCLAADILGCCGSAVAMAVAYAKSRVQFGRPIGSFQAVKHLCAEMIADLEPARSLVWYAAHAFDAAPEEATLAAALAKSHLADIGGRIVRAATEVHGGIGFTEDCDLQLHFKRVQLDRQLLGGPQRLREVAARWQGWGSSSGTDRHRDP